MDEAEHKLIERLLAEAEMPAGLRLILSNWLYAHHHLLPSEKAMLKQLESTFFNPQSAGQVQWPKP